MMTNDDERGGGGKKCRKYDDVICERPLRQTVIASRRAPHLLLEQSVLMAIQRMVDARFTYTNQVLTYDARVAASQLNISLFKHLHP